MGSPLQLAFVATIALLDACQAKPIIARPKASHIVVDASNTLNSTNSSRPYRLQNEALAGINLPDLPKIPSVLGPDPLANITIPLLDPNDPSSSSTPTSAGGGAAHAPSPLALAFVNNRPSSNLTAYVTGLDPDGKLVMLQNNGKFYYPQCTSSSGVPEPISADVAIPLGGPGSSVNTSIPDYLSGARIWFAEGKLNFFTVPGTSGANLVEPSATDPNDPSANVSWGFAELTWQNNYGIFADISYVDFVGLPIGMDLVSTNGSVQSAKGLPSDAVQKICDDLTEQGSKDGLPWGDLCVKDTTGRPLRVLAPGDYMNQKPASFKDFWTPYVDRVWDHFATNNLTIVTQAAAGNVSCNIMNNGSMTCAGDNRCYEKPTAQDIFGCNSGPFGIQQGDNDVHKAVVPRLCAAFNRGTLLLQGGQEQPALASHFYYTDPVNNWYSSIVHKHEIDGRGYAFAYDDVVPDGGTDQAGCAMSPNPQVLTITIGGPSGS